MTIARRRFAGGIRLQKTSLRTAGIHGNVPLFCGGPKGFPFANGNKNLPQKCRDPAESCVAQKSKGETKGNHLRNTFSFAQNLRGSKGGTLRTIYFLSKKTCPRTAGICRGSHLFTHCLDTWDPTAPPPSELQGSSTIRPFGGTPEAHLSPPPQAIRGIRPPGRPEMHCNKL